MEKKFKGGSTIKINEEGIAFISNPKLPKEIEIGKRYSTTLNPTFLKTPEILRKKTGIKRALWIEKARCYLGLDDEGDWNWLNENWPVQKTTVEKWKELTPDCVKELRKWNDKMSEYQYRFNKAMEDEARSSFAPSMPKDEKPELTDEGKAWIEINKLYNSQNYFSIGKKAVESVVEDGASLLEAFRKAVEEKDKEIEKHIWD